MARDPYKYFRIEAAELLEGLSEGILALGKQGDPELIKRLLRYAHTLKGASRVVRRPEIGDLAHALEDLLAPLRESDGGGSPELIDQSLALLDQIRDHLASLPVEKRSPSAEADGPPQAVQEQVGQAQTIRIAVSDLDRLLQSALEAHALACSLRRGDEEIDVLGNRARKFLRGQQEVQVGPGSSQATKVDALLAEVGSALRERREREDRLLRELSELRACASELRLVPARSLIIDLERVARDAARTLDKEVEVRVEGAELHIDAYVLAGLRKALVHVIRNCVAHGIEGREARRRAGKPSIGRIDIRIRRQGHRVALSCQDDGAGLDSAAVQRAVVERGLISRAEAASLAPDAIGNLLLRGGVTTSHGIDGISGRGVGLDAVREAVTAMKGEVALKSTPGVGTQVELSVPLSLSSLPALSLEVEGKVVFVPLDNVRRTLRLPTRSIARDTDSERVVVDDHAFPYLSLTRALGHPRGDVAAIQSVVLIEAAGQQAAIGVDRIGATRTVVIRGIPGHAAAHPMVAGAAFDDDGVPRLVLAADALIREASKATLPDPLVAAIALPPLLVIDDSLTTRMLEQSILESAGYEVDIAVSGEDGIDKARRRRYGAFIVDVEMPGMSGFEFISAIRSDAELCNTPAILVTSLANRKDKARGSKIGANAYIVKSEFDQAVLLKTIGRLLA